MNSIDHIFYINLNHREDRNTEIQTELNNFDIHSNKYERFSAVYHSEIGGVGCGRSHIQVLRLAKERGYKRILVLEDDFMFTISKPDFYEAMENLKQLDHYDVCLLSANVIQYKEYDKSTFFQKVIEAETTSGYIINEHYYDKLIDIFENATNMFELTNSHWLYAIDVAWKSLQLTDDWYVFNPRIGKQRPSYSDCGNTFSNVSW